MNRYLLFLLLIPLLGTGQTQIGQKIEGDTGTDAFGQSVAISGNGNIIAVGADQYNSYMGHVRVYEEVSGTWTQIGNDIEGDSSGDWSGRSIALSVDGSIIAIGAPFNDDGATDSGHVRVFENISGIWTQIGNAIEGDGTWDESGTSVALSADGTIVAIGAPRHNGNGNESGQVRVFENVQGTWTQVGSDIYGLQIGHGLGISCSLSSDGSILVIGAVSRSTAATPASYSMVFQNVSGSWTQIGQTIHAVAPLNQSGRSVSISSDGNIIADRKSTRLNSSHVRISYAVFCLKKKKKKKKIKMPQKNTKSDHITHRHVRNIVLHTGVCGILMMHMISILTCSTSICD